MAKNDDWRNSSEPFSDSEHRKEAQRKSKEVRRKKELMKSGNIGLNLVPSHSKAIMEKSRRAEKKKDTIQHIKEEKSKAGGYDPSFAESNVQRSVENMAGQTAQIKQTAESIYLPRAAPKGKTKGASAYTLADYSNNLLSAVELICVDKHLFFYNGICHESINGNELISLYRNYVEKDICGERNLAVFRELYSYLLADDSLKVDESRMAPAECCFLTNGIFDVKKQKLIKQTSNLIAFSFVNARYVENPVCKKFDRFLEVTMQGDKILLRRFWYMLAYIFMQSLDAKAFFVLGTAPNSGKSQMGRLIQQLYLPKYVSAVALNDMNKEFSIAPIVGTAVNLNMDLPNGRLNSAAVSKVKQLTGGDLINVNEKFVRQFKYLNRAKLIFGTNYPIKLFNGIGGSDEDAFWDRMVFIPFMYSVPKDKQNPRLLEELLAEKDSIVSKALQYGRDLLEESYLFPGTPEIDRTVAGWRNDCQYFVDKFLAECCDMGDTGARESMDNLYRVYCRFCEMNDEAGQSRSLLKSCIGRCKGVRHLKARLDNAANPRSAFEGIRLSDYGRMLLGVGEKDASTNVFHE